jgi:hypothetical protein
MSEAKTQATTSSVAEFIKALPDVARQKACRQLSALMSKATGAKPVLWGSNIVGFGSYRYTYATGRAGDWPLIAFSPRKNDLTLYLMDGFEAHADKLASLGKHKTGKSCLYLKSLDAVDPAVLQALIEDSVAAMRLKHAGACT